MDTTWDVVVVGAGPAGSGAAATLAGWGLRTLVVEEHPAIGAPVCCSGIVGRECLTAFPVPPAVVLRELGSATCFAPSGKALRAVSPLPQAFVVERGAFDRCLAQRAQERGTEYLLAAPVQGVSIEGGKVQVHIAGGNGRRLEARVAILAPGFPSPLPGSTGLGEPRRWAVAAQVEVETREVEEVEVYLGQDIAPGFFAWLVPTLPGTGLVGVMASRPGPYLSGFLHRLYQQGKIRGPLAPACFRRLPLSPPPRTWGERVLLVGEAAGQVKATTGGGIYYGLLCAQIAAATVKEAFLSGNFSPRRFQKYERGWKARLGQEMLWAGWARRLYARLSNGQIEEILSRMEALGLVDSLLEMEGFSFDWHSPAIRYALKQEAFRGLRRFFPFRMSRSG